MKLIDLGIALIETKAQCASGQSDGVCPSDDTRRGRQFGPVTY